ncbi:C-type natriuretic peptide-like [Pithys albifrons albifrons]|uniref:C-type natriuretic peptide-like n=1 Tax=Pithys albifrons albifrons TaxID=3385563 RepID=UPI003A5D207B
MEVGGRLGILEWNPMAARGAARVKPRGGGRSIAGRALSSARLSPQAEGTAGGGGGGGGGEEGGAEEEEEKEEEEDEAEERGVTEPRARGQHSHAPAPRPRRARPPRAPKCGRGCGGSSRAGGRPSPGFPASI